MRVTAVVLASALFVAACQSDTPFVPDAPPPHSDLSGVALRVQVDVEHGTVQVLSGTRPDSSGRAYAILGGTEAGITVTNLVRSAPANNKVTVTFDVAVTNRLTAATLVAPSFPPTVPGSGGLILFPFLATQVVGGAPASVMPNAEWNGDGSPGSGAPRNFFNDFGCTTGGATSDCFRWEQFAAPLGPGETTAPQRVGYTIPKGVQSFTALLVLAADISSDLPAVAAIVVTPPGYVMNDGFPANFSATAYDAQNHVLPWPTITWTSADATALEFQNGSALQGTITGPSVIVHGRKVGQTSFTVSSGGVKVVVPVDIQVNTIVLLQLYAAPTMVVGDQQQGDLRVKDNSGNIVPGIQATWVTSDPTVLQVDQAGLITAVGPGTAMITATAGIASVSVTIDVLTPAALTVLVNDGGSNANPQPIAGADITVTGGQAPVTGRTDLSGVATLAVGGSGTYTVEVSRGGCNGSVSFSVALTAGQTTAATAGLDCPQLAALSVTVTTALGNPLAGQAIFITTSLPFIPGSWYLTDQNGHVGLGGLPTAALNLDVTPVPAGCIHPTPTWVTPVAGATTSVSLTVSCNGF